MDLRPNDCRFKSWPKILALCPWTRHLISIASLQLKCISGRLKYTCVHQTVYKCCLRYTCVRKECCCSSVELPLPRHVDVAHCSAPGVTVELWWIPWGKGNGKGLVTTGMLQQTVCKDFFFQFWECMHRFGNNSGHIVQDYMTLQHIWRTEYQSIRSLKLVLFIC